MEGAKEGDSFEGIYAAYLEFEAANNLFHETVSEVWFWEIVRYQVFREVLRQRGIFARNAYKKKGGGRLARILKLSISTLMVPRLLSDRQALIFFGHPRRKKGADGLYWDIYCDPILENLGGERATLFEPPLGTEGHYSPAKTDRLVWLDGFNAVARFLRLFFRSYSSHELEKLTQWQERLNFSFGVEVDLLGKVKKEVARFKAHRLLWNVKFFIARPRALFVVVPYGKEGLLASCFEKNVPTIELQHGSPTPGKINYDYSDSRPKRYKPDYVFTFGEFWRDYGAWPVSSERVRVIGFPYLEESLRKHVDVPKENIVLVLSQPVLSHELAKFVQELAAQIPEDLRLFFKLHPAEVENWPKKYPELNKEPKVEVVSDASQTLHLLQARARWQIGVYSTAIYEGIAFGCTTFILNLSGASYMENLIESGVAKKVTGAGDIDFDWRPHKRAREYIFNPAWQKNFRKQLDKILKEK